MKLLLIKVNFRHLLLPIFVTLIFIGLAFLTHNNTSRALDANKTIFEYTVQVSKMIEEVDIIFERSEVNVTVLADYIYNTYNRDKQNDKNYNFNYINHVDGLVKSVIVNSPGADGAWFQINADLPFSVRAYNWYEFRDDQFVNVKNKFAGTAAMDRRITPEDDPYYFEAIYNKKNTWSDIYTDIDTNMPMMTISAPVYKDATLIGVVGIDISINNLQQALKNMQREFTNSELFLLDEKNKVILSQLLPDSSDPSSKDNYIFLELFKKPNNGWIEYHDRGKRKIAIKLTLSNNDKLVMTFNDSNLFNELNNLFVLIYILFFCLIMTTVIAFVLKYKINNKIATDNLVISEKQEEANDGSEDEEHIEI